ncbi:hypothetical protein HZS_1009 [Henneguya salminicola]|nr:hypothetical protein HZS_1009 [Henneguya salminicola]
MPALFLIILTTLIENIETVYYRCSKSESQLCPAKLIKKDKITVKEELHRRQLLLRIHQFQRNRLLCLYPHKIYESLLIELRIKYASSVYIFNKI